MSALTFRISLTNRFQPNDGLQVDGGTALVVAQGGWTAGSGGAAPAAEPWALGARGTMKTNRCSVQCS